MKIHLNNKRNNGFTLIEIMIVVAIIGLLAAIAIPNFVSARTTAQKTTCLNNLRLISSAKAQYALENPSVLESIVPTSLLLTPYFGKITGGSVASVVCPT